jgi:DNA polymerase-2
LEGIYKWIVFLPSKTYPQNQVANRYFGCFEETNELKTRGIEVRRHDTPSYFRECQNEILREFAKCDFVPEVKEVAQTKAIEIFNNYAKGLEDHRVSVLDLVIRRRLSKELEEYGSKRHLSVGAAKKLEKSGLKLRAGQSVSYVITKHDSSGSNRSEPEELVGGEYDSKRYVELLADCAATVLSPFGVTKEILLSRSRPLTI